ncbi:unnamed protein product [Musa acuminata subsp. malaccensis]|uniref:(wild Malaysian banana) hypothetical protein n=1 Tax=Musa acuminata subsp. malaccensis TaxID=214687 RepID=A0A804K4E0_MUSAM|nr:unnamed protein product [Musa acuminata subsp. malaccensis]
MHHQLSFPHPRRKSGSWCTKWSSAEGSERRSSCRRRRRRRRRGHKTARRRRGCSATRGSLAGSRGAAPAGRRTPSPLSSSSWPVLYVLLLP